MEIKELARSKFGKRIVNPGDTVEVVYTRTADLGSGEVVWDREVVCKAEVEEEMEVDEAVVFEFRNFLGLRKGLGGVFGEGKK